MSDKTFYILHLYYNLFIIYLSIFKFDKFKLGLFTTSSIRRIKYKKQVTIMNEYGTIKIKLDELIKKSGMSKNKLSHKAEMQRTQINNYCKNNITRLDTDVLARICTVFNCKIEDVIEFIPPQNSNE